MGFCSGMSVAVSAALIVVSYCCINSREETQVPTGLSQRAKRPADCYVKMKDN
jgi:hypothetical protein